MKKDIFREKSLERIESPDQLNTYIRVANPGVWLVLSIIIVFLIGFIIWGIFGDLSIYTPALVAPNNGSIPSLKSEYLVYVHEEDSGPVGINRRVEINGKMYRICEEDKDGQHLVLFGGRDNIEDMVMAHDLGHDLAQGQNLWMVAYGVDYTGEPLYFEEPYIRSRVEIAKRSPLSFLFD